MVIPPVNAQSTDNNVPAVSGENTSSGGGIGVYGHSKNKGGYGVLGESTDGRGVVAISVNDYGLRASSTNLAGIRGSSVNGRGVEGWATAVEGVVGTSVTGPGVLGITIGDQQHQPPRTNSPGVFGSSTWGPGLLGTSKFGPGVVATTEDAAATAIDARNNQPGGIAIIAEADNAIFADGGIVCIGGISCIASLYAIQGECNNPEGYAGSFLGNVEIRGALEKSGGGFKIDHPLDPANQYLSHSFVESPTRSNIYDGIAVLNSQGEATVFLPDWFEKLNSDFRYQLTSIGGAAPEIHISDKIKDNKFQIAGGKPGLEISWQVTGRRMDAWAQHNPLVVEEEKKEAERGKYLHPTLHGEHESKALGRGKPFRHKR
jgi:hypothetical protein